MTSDYATFSPNLTVAQAIDRLCLEAPDKETIYYVYVVDETRKLIGFVSLKDLIPARVIQKYDLLDLSAINGGDALVGIITRNIPRIWKNSWPSPVPRGRGLSQDPGMGPFQEPGRLDYRLAALGLVSA